MKKSYDGTYPSEKVFLLMQCATKTTNTTSLTGSWIETNVKVKIFMDNMLLLGIVSLLMQALKKKKKKKSK